MSGAGARRLRAGVPRLTLSGWALVLGSLGLAALSQDPGPESRRQLQLWAAHLVAATVFTSMLVTWLSVRQLAVAAVEPRVGYAGRTAPVVLTLVQRSLFPAMEVSVRLAVPGTAAWELERVPCVTRGTPVEREVDLPFTARGSYEWMEVEVRAAPLLLCTGRASIALPVDITVFPAVEVLERPPVAPGSPVSPSGDAPLMRPGNDLEFLGLRPYVPGDSPRLVHWPASARTGRLHVREQARLSTADVALCVDLSPGIKTAAEEDLVTVAASLALHLHGRAVPTQLWLAADRQVIIPSGSGRSHMEGVQAALTHARAATTPGVGLPALIRQRAPQLARGSVLAVIAMRPALTRELRTLLEQFQAADLRPMAVVLAPELYDQEIASAGSAPRPRRDAPVMRTEVPEEWVSGKPGAYPVFAPDRPLQLASLLARIG